MGDKCKINIELGDTINYQGLKGTITGINRPIGFLAECNGGKATYTIEFYNVPEDKIIKTDGTDRKDSGISGAKETECVRGES